MINKVIKKLIYYDFLIQFSGGLLSPIFAVFILRQIPGSSLKVIGLSTLFYWIARVTTTVPLSRFMDKTDGERDEFYFAVIGSMIVASIPLMYLLVRAPWQLYLIQFIFGLANSMAVPAWRILFIDHLDKGKTGFEWSLEDVGVGIAVGASAYFGSLIADHFGFSLVMKLVSIMSYMGTVMLLTLNKQAKTLPEIKKANKLTTMRARRRTLLPKKPDIRRVSGVA